MPQKQTLTGFGPTLVTKECVLRPVARIFSGESVNHEKVDLSHDVKSVINCDSILEIYCCLRTLEVVDLL